MATIRMSEEIRSKVHAHLYGSRGEHFAFLLADWTYSHDRPVFMVRDVVLIQDKDVTVDWTGWTVHPERLVAVVNAAVKQRRALIEVHNHGGRRPRFSRTDEAGFDDFVPYVLSSLPDRPYGATVWGDADVHGQYFLPGGKRGTVDSITVLGKGISQVASWDGEIAPSIKRYDRQQPWFTKEGQRQLANLRIALVGLGGTGSQLVVQLTYLGARRFLLIDGDRSDDTSMNRLVTAGVDDVDKPKVLLARRRIRSICRDAKIATLNRKLESPKALDRLKRADVIFGCVDDDGPRLLLSELASAYGIPYFDLAVGIQAKDGAVSAAGGRVAVLLPDTPCLKCMGEIDANEARFYFSTPEQKEFLRRQRYVDGMDIVAPSVVMLNGAVAAMAASEFALWMSGVRQVNPFTELDLLGQGRTIPSQWATPRRVSRDPDCVICALAGAGDQAGIEPRYARPK